jgi:DNA/RNA-binding domain of Phe-tRNA-synthetase-like protein
VEQDGVTDQASVEHCQFAQADHMKCKTDKIRAAWAGGDKIGALRIAARFFDRSADTLAFKRGIDAHNNPGFYRQLGKDPAQLVRSAIEALARRFNLG